jgi:CDP-diacylglycerol--glycerol-3-phosphate 3-phosphatidyltransferase
MTGRLTNSQTKSTSKMRPRHESLDNPAMGFESIPVVAMTTANKITIFRILLVPVFAYAILTYRDSGQEGHRWLALGAFALAAILDGVDGFIARHFHQKSELGAVLDPTADKLLLASGVVLLSLDQIHLTRLPLWLILVIISRDTILLLGLIIVHITVGRCVVRPRWTGKVATVRWRCHPHCHLRRPVSLRWRTPIKCQSPQRSHTRTVVAGSP